MVQTAKDTVARLIKKIDQPCPWVLVAIALVISALACYFYFAKRCPPMTPRAARRARRSISKGEETSGLFAYFRASTPTAKVQPPKRTSPRIAARKRA